MIAFFKFSAQIFFITKKHRVKSRLLCPFFKEFLYSILFFWFDFWFLLFFAFDSFLCFFNMAKKNKRCFHKSNSNFLCSIYNWNWIKTENKTEATISVKGYTTFLSYIGYQFIYIDVSIKMLLNLIKSHLYLGVTSRTLKLLFYVKFHDF